MDLICVKCGVTAKAEGSMKHPYCQKCFQDVWGGDNKLYAEWLLSEHNNPLGVSPEAFVHAKKHPKNVKEQMINDLIVATVFIFCGAVFFKFIPESKYMKITNIFGFTLSDYSMVLGLFCILAASFLIAMIVTSYMHKDENENREDKGRI